MVLLYNIYNVIVFIKCWPHLSDLINRVDPGSRRHWWCPGHVFCLVRVMFRWTNLQSNIFHWRMSVQSSSRSCSKEISIVFCFIPGHSQDSHSPAPQKSWTNVISMVEKEENSLSVLPSPFHCHRFTKHTLVSRDSECSLASQGYSEWAMGIFEFLPSLEMLIMWYHYRGFYHG